MGSKKKWLRRKLFESFQQEEEVQAQPEPAPVESVVEKVKSKVLPRGRASKKSKK
tara:strand:+ start:4043 stop:4207 length:165 start_codon:yes stop_codon:yes gene_type:complete